MPNWKKVIVSGSDAFLNSLVVTEGITGSTAIFEGNTTTELVRITQLGTGDALRVEDTTNPDATPTVITKDGDVFIGSGSAPQSGGGNSPKLYIKNGSSGYTGNLAIDTAMLFEGNGATYYATLSPDSSVSGMYMGSPSDVFGAFVRWGYDAGRLQLGAAQVGHSIEFTVGNKSQTSMQLRPNAIGTGDPHATLYITGSLTVSGSNSVVNLQELQFDTEHTASGHTTGRIYWDDANKTFTGDMQGSDVRLQIGQEEHVYAKNTSGVTINNGDAVRISGAAGANVTITKAISTIKSFKDATEQDQILGVATEQIPDNQSGYVTTFGAVRDLDTSAFSEGDILYLSATTSGSYNNTRPLAPNFEARVGVVQVSNATEGVVLVRPQEPTFLTDISQVTSSGVITNEKTYLVYNDSTDLISFTNEFSGSFSGSFQGKLGPISNATYRLTSSFYTASVSDYRVGVRYTQTGSVSIQLPLIANAGEIEYRFKDEEGNAKKNNITIVASGSNLIDGDANAIMNRNYMAISLYNDGTSNWFIE